MKTNTRYRFTQNQVSTLTLAFYKNKEEIQRRLNDGLSIAELANEHKMGRQSMSGILKSCGITTPRIAAIANPKASRVKVIMRTLKTLATSLGVETPDLDKYL